MMEINRLGGELSGAGRLNEPLKNDTAKKPPKASSGTESSLLSLKVQLPDAETLQASRSEKVEQLRASIAAGTYNPDPVMVARKILGVA